MNNALPRAGDRAPLLVGKSLQGGDWWLTSAAGDYVVLCFVNFGAEPALRGLIAALSNLLFANNE